MLNRQFKQSKHLIGSTTQEEIDRKIKPPKLHYTFWNMSLSDRDQQKSGVLL